MQLICTSLNFLTPDQEHLLAEKHIDILHKAKLAPVYIIEHDDIEAVKAAGVFERVREADIFSVADVSMFPNVPQEPLRRLTAVGWGGIKVGVLDSGVKSDQVRISYSKDFTGFGSFIINNHGTKVAKIIKHYSPGAQIFSFKIAHDGNDIKEGFVLMALDDAIEQEVDLINLSIGFARQCKGTCDLCNYVDLVVQEAGIIVVAAAGNNGQWFKSTITCPGAAEKAVTVGAVQPGKAPAQFSSVGEPGFDKPNLLASGLVNVTFRYPSGQLVESDAGTSFAAPVITGVLASLLSVFPNKPEIITKLYQTCECLGLPRHFQGFGLLDLEKLVEVFENDATISRTDSGQK